MTHQGYIKLWRKSIDSGLIKNHNVWIFWTWCLLKANYRPDQKQVVGFQEVVLQPGQFVFGRKSAAKETGLSEQNIRTCLRFLENCKNLTIKPTNKFSVITIINWDTYQGNGTDTNQQSNQHLTSIQPASNHKQEVKNIKNNFSTVNTVLVDEATTSSTPAPQNCPHKEIRNLYNHVLGDTLPRCKLTTTSFDKMLRTRWREDPERQSMVWWEKYFNYIRESDFLMGRTDNDFMASFEWIIRPTNMAKIINGNYHKKGKKQQSIEEYAKEHGYV